MFQKQLSLPPPGYVLNEEAHARLAKVQRRLKLLAALCAPVDDTADNAQVCLPREALAEMLSDLAADCGTATASATWTGATLGGLP